MTNLMFFIILGLPISIALWELVIMLLIAMWRFINDD